MVIFFSETHLTRTVPLGGPQLQDGTASSTVGILLTRGFCLAKFALCDLRRIILALLATSKFQFPKLNTENMAMGRFSDVTRYDLSAAKAYARKYP